MLGDGAGAAVAGRGAMAGSAGEAVAGGGAMAVGAGADTGEAARRRGTAGSRPMWGAMARHTAMPILPAAMAYSARCLKVAANDVVTQAFLAVQRGCRCHQDGNSF